MIVKAEKDFWINHIEKKIPPALDGSSAAEKYLNEKYKAAELGACIDFEL